MEASHSWIEWSCGRSELTLLPIRPRRLLERLLRERYRPSALGSWSGIAWIAGNFGTLYNSFSAVELVYQHLSVIVRADGPRVRIVFMRGDDEKRSRRRA